MTDPREALRLLKAGNARFVANRRQLDPHGRDHAGHENPVAIVLGCCDHRVPPDIIFDQGLGNLFTVRVAGNIVTSTQLGSIEFGLLTSSPRLIVVLGHQRCGAVMATLRDRLDNKPPASEHLAQIVEKIAPACARCIAANPGLPFEELAVKVTHENVAHSIKTLRSQSDILRDLIDNDGLTIVGAYYHMVSGEVRFLGDA